MTKKQCKKFSAEIKTKIILEMLKEESTVSELASKYNITGKTIQNWRRQFIENAPIAFEPAKAVSEYKKQIEELKEQNEELAKALGKTTVERDWAVGKLNSLDLETHLTQE